MLFPTEECMDSGNTQSHLFAKVILSDIGHLVVEKAQRLNHAYWQFIWAACKGGCYYKFQNRFKKRTRLEGRWRLPEDVFFSPYLGTVGPPRAGWTSITLNRWMPSVVPPNWSRESFNLLALIPCITFPRYNVYLYSESFAKWFLAFLGSSQGSI